MAAFPQIEIEIVTNGYVLSCLNKNHDRPKQIFSTRRELLAALEEILAKQDVTVR